MFTDDGFSLTSGFTKILCSPENPLLILFELVRQIHFKNIDFILLLLISRIEKILLEGHAG